jgi:hypothetical protein
METTTAPETAEIKEETTTVETSLESSAEIELQKRLSMATERKPEPEIKKVDVSFFGTDDEAEATAAVNKVTEELSVKTESKENKAQPITEAAKRASARTAVGMLDLTLQSLLTPIHGWKFKRKFKSEEIKKIDEYIDDTTIDKLEAEEDKKLKRRWDRLLKKYEKKKDAIPLDEKEKKDLETAFYQYFDFKEKTLPPEWFIGMAITNAVGKRAIDLIAD